MPMNEPAAESPAVSWREQAVSRSLDSARVRAEHRVQRFIDAALELMSESPSGKDFTVQDVLATSGQSLRAFYQYFGGKQELLLAVFEESVRSTAETLRERIGGEQSALERLHRFVVEYYWLCHPTAKKAGRKKRSLALAEFAQQLMTTHPEEATRVFAPVVSLFDEVLEDAVAAGVVRGELSQRRLAGVIGGVILEAIMFNAFSTTISGSFAEQDGADPAEELWDLVLHGIGSGSSD
jgi:AcrR family transcriptional regulator